MAGKNTLPLMSVFASELPKKRMSTPYYIN